MMKNIRFNFIDENFGDEVENILIWDERSFILITIIENKITIKEYDEITELFKETITNKSELEFLRNVIKEQDGEIKKLEDKIQWLRKKEKH